MRTEIWAVSSNCSGGAMLSLVLMCGRPIPYRSGLAGRYAYARAGLLCCASAPSELREAPKIQCIRTKTSEGRCG